MGIVKPGRMRLCMGWHGAICEDCRRLVRTTADEDADMIERGATVRGAKFGIAFVCPCFKPTLDAVMDVTP